MTTLADQIHETENNDFFSEDHVTPLAKMPKWIIKDPFCDNKWNFKFRRFDIAKYVAMPELGSFSELKEWTWTKFNSTVSKIATIIFNQLNTVYKHGISSKFRRHISATINSTFPALESTYERMRQEAAEGHIQEIKKTTLKPDTFTVILIFVFHYLKLFVY